MGGRLAQGREITSRLKATVLDAEMKVRLPAFIHVPLSDFICECRLDCWGPMQPKLAQSPAGQKLLALTDRQKIDICLYAYEQIAVSGGMRRSREMGSFINDAGWQIVISGYLRGKLPFSQADMTALLGLMSNRKGEDALWRSCDVPTPDIMTAIERVTSANGLSPDAKSHIRAFLDKLYSAPHALTTKAATNIYMRLQALLQVRDPMPEIQSAPRARAIGHSHSPEQIAQARAYVQNWLRRILRPDYQANMTPEEFDQHADEDLARYGVAHWLKEETNFIKGEQTTVLEETAARVRHADARDTLSDAAWNAIGALVYDSAECNAATAR